MGEERIKVRTEAPLEERAGLPRLGKTATKVFEIGIESLSGNLKTFIARIQRILDEQQENTSTYYIDEVELNLTVNASGGIELVGKLEAGAMGGIKIKLKKRK